MSDNTNNGFPVPEEPLTREEQYLSAIAGVTEATEIPEMPLTRVEAYLNEIVENGGGSVYDKLEAGTNINIEETSDGKAKISASGEVSSEDTYAREQISAILDGSTIDSFGDVETALADKVDKVEGKGLSANDFTDTLKTKLDGIAAGAEVNVQSDWAQTDNTADDYIKGKPNLATVATSGAYSDLSGTPTLGTAAAAASTDFATAAQGTKADSAVQSVKVNGSALTPDANKAVDITAIPASIVSAGALASGMTATTQSTSDDSTKLATTAYVHDVVDALPEPMIFTGSITLTADSTDTSTAAITVSAPASAADIVKGYTYKVTSIASSPVYTGSIKVGDTLIAAKNAPTVSASWVADTDWTIVPSGDETGYVVGLPSGTSSGQLMAFGADGYTAANSGVSVANNTTGISDVDTAVPTSKAVIHKTAHAATLDDYTPETGTYTDKITTADTIDSAIKKLDTRSRANENNILSLTPTVKDSGNAFTVGTDYTLCDACTLTVPILTSGVKAAHIMAGLAFNSTAPRGIIISLSNDSADFNTSSKMLAKVESSDYIRLTAECFYYNYGGTAVNIYIWAKSNTSGTNRVVSSMQLLN